MRVGEPSLDQLRIFVAIVDEGSFGGAARKMGRAVSAISYGMQQMEAQLGMTLFAREGSRKPKLTEDGIGLLAEVRAITNASDALLAKTRSLHAGLESEVSLVLDVMVPGAVIARVLKAFRAKFPTVSLKLNVEGLGAVAECVLNGEAELGIAGPVVSDHTDLEKQGIGEVELIPIAAPDHALAQQGIKPGESRKHLQIVLADRSSLTDGMQFSVLSPMTWRLGDLGSKHILLRQGVGWGNMPRHQVAQDLISGELVELDLPEKPGDRYILSALWRRDKRPGPATHWLIAAFKDAL